MNTVRTLLITVEEVKERIRTFPTVVVLLERAAKRFKVSTFRFGNERSFFIGVVGLGRMRQSNRALSTPMFLLRLMRAQSDTTG